MVEVLPVDAGSGFHGAERVPALAVDAAAAFDALIAAVAVVAAAVVVAAAAAV